MDVDLSGAGSAGGDEGVSGRWIAVAVELRVRAEFGVAAELTALGTDDDRWGGGYEFGHDQTSLSSSSIIACQITDEGE